MSVTIPKRVTEERILLSFVEGKSPTTGKMVTRQVDRKELLRMFGPGADAVINKLVRDGKLRWVGEANGPDNKVTLMLTAEGGRKAIIDILGEN